MTKQDRAQEREEIAARNASLKATQEKFEREREEYFQTTMQNGKEIARRSGPRRWGSSSRGRKREARSDAPGFFTTSSDNRRGADSTDTAHRNRHRVPVHNNSLGHNPHHNNRSRVPNNKAPTPLSLRR